MGNFPLYSFLLPMPLLLPMMSRSLATGQNGARVGGATRHGQLFISLCYNKYHRKPTVWPTVAAPHAKERILNSKLESILAQPTVASRSSCIARSIPHPVSPIPYPLSPIPYPVSSGSKCNLANVHVSWANIFIGFLGWTSLGSGRRIRSASKMHLQRG